MLEAVLDVGYFDSLELGFGAGACSVGLIPGPLDCYFGLLFLDQLVYREADIAACCDELVAWDAFEGLAVCVMCETEEIAFLGFLLDEVDHVRSLASLLYRELDVEVDVSAREPKFSEIYRILLKHVLCLLRFKGDDVFCKDLHHGVQSDVVFVVLSSCGLAQYVADGEGAFCLEEFFICVSFVLHYIEDVALVRNECASFHVAHRCVVVLDCRVLLT